MNSLPKSQTAEKNSGMEELDTLRDLLLGEQARRVEEISNQLGNTEMRLARLVKDLPEALGRSSLDHASVLRLATALRKPVEEALRQGVENDRDHLAELLVPALAKALPRAIFDLLARVPGKVWESAKSLAGMGSAKRLARRGGLFRMEEEDAPFRVRRACLYTSTTAEQIMVADADEDDLAEPGPLFRQAQAVLRNRADLGERGMGDAQMPKPPTSRRNPQGLLVVESSLCTLVALYSGKPPSWAKDRLQALTDEMDALVGGRLLDPENEENNRALAAMLDKTLIAYEPVVDTTKNDPWIYGALWKDAAVVAFTIFIVASVSFLTRASVRWNETVRALDAEPGVVVVERSWLPGRSITGLLDPLAPNPADLLAARGYTPGSLDLKFTPFVSDDEPFKSQRASLQLAERDAVQRDINRSYAKALALMDATLSQMDHQTRTASGGGPVVQRDDLRLELLLTLLELPASTKIELRNGILAIPSDLSPNLKARIRDSVKSIPWITKIVEADLPAARTNTSSVIHHEFLDGRPAAAVKERAFGLRRP